MLAAVLVIVLVVLMLYDVVLRYAFNAPTSWGNDLNTFLMGGSFVLSIAYAMSTDSHVRVDLLYNRADAAAPGVCRPDRAHPDRPAGRRLDHLGTVRAISRMAFRTGERIGSGGWNPVVWPFELILLIGFAIFTMQIAGRDHQAHRVAVGRPFDVPVSWLKIMASEPLVRAGPEPNCTPLPLPSSAGMAACRSLHRPKGPLDVAALDVPGAPRARS